MLARLVRGVLLLVLLAAVVWAGFQILGWALGFIVGAVLFAIRVGVLVAFAAGCVWAYRKLTRRKSKGRGELQRGLDWQFLRGRMDRETYLRRKALGPPR